jgi:hypothetical protein
MAKIISITFLIFLTACTTPETVLKNKETGQVTRCGGDVAYAGILYPFMLQADSKCVSEYKQQGFDTIPTPNN